MNNKQNKTHHTHPNKPHTPPEQDVGEGGKPHRNYMVQTPLPEKKLKNFKKLKNSDVITYKIPHCQN